MLYKPGERAQENSIMKPSQSSRIIVALHQLQVILSICDHVQIVLICISQKLPKTQRRMGSKISTNKNQSLSNLMEPKRKNSSPFLMNLLKLNHSKTKLQKSNKHKTIH